jgi:hypothetical protein
MSPIFKPNSDSPMKASFHSCDRSDDRCLGPGELRLVEGMQTSLTETVTVLSARIRYLEDLVDTYRRELAEVTDIKISLRVKEIECHDLVCLCASDAGFCDYASKTIDAWASQPKFH